MGVGEHKRWLDELRSMLEMVDGGQLLYNSDKVEPKYVKFGLWSSMWNQEEEVIMGIRFVGRLEGVPG